MLPSKKIFLGASAIITGVLGHLILAQLLNREILSTVSNPGGGSAAGELVDQRLVKLHEQTIIGFNAMTLSYLFMVTGIVVLLTGIYHNAQTTERLEANLTKNGQ